MTLGRPLKIVLVPLLMLGVGSARTETDTWSAQVHRFRGIDQLSQPFQRFFMYECVEGHGTLLTCFQNMVILKDASVAFAYGDYTPTRIAHIKGIRPFLERVALAIVGDAKTDSLKLGRLLAWSPSWRPLPAYVGPLPIRVVEPANGRNGFYRNSEEWVMIDGYGDCAAHARVLILLCQTLDIPARIVQLQNHHTCIEAYLDGRWVFGDAKNGRMLFREDGRPASAWEVHQKEKVHWGRVGVPLTDNEKTPSVENTKEYLAVFDEVCVGNYGDVPVDRRETVPFFNVSTDVYKDTVDLAGCLTLGSKSQADGPWVCGSWDILREHPDFTPFHDMFFRGQGAISVELLGRYGLRSTVGLYFGGQGPEDCWGFILYETYGAKLFRCRNNQYRDLAVVDYPTRANLPYRLSVVVEGDTIHGFINGKQVLVVRTSRSHVAPGPIGMFNSVEAHGAFKNLLITSPALAASLR